MVRWLKQTIYLIIVIQTKRKDRNQIQIPNSQNNYTILTKKKAGHNMYLSKIITGKCCGDEQHTIGRTATAAKTK